MPSAEWLEGARDVLAELERRRCFTTARARREVDRLRSRLGATSTLLNPSDMVQPPCPHLETLREMHRYLFPELHDTREPVYQWHAGTIEDVASILNRALGMDGEGRNPEQRAAHLAALDARYGGSAERRARAMGKP
jgi:hypothetical protein